jgi:intracellular septation protein
MLEVYVSHTASASVARMQLLFDFFPLVAFFVAYKLAGIYVATAVLIVAVLVQTAVQWIRFRKVSTMSLVSAALVLVFGGLTLLIHDKAFIQLKPTVINALFAIAFLASSFIGEQPLVQRIMGSAITLERSAWLKLNWMWIAYFLVQSGLNLYVVRNFSEEFWVNFKLFGQIGLTVAFILWQGIWLASRHSPEAASETPPGPSA